MYKHKLLNVPEDADSPKNRDTLVQMREVTFCLNHWEFQRVELSPCCSMLPSTFQHSLDRNCSDAFHSKKQGKMCVCWVTDHLSLKLRGISIIASSPTVEDSVLRTK